MAESNSGSGESDRGQQVIGSVTFLNMGIGGGAAFFGSETEEWVSPCGSLPASRISRFTGEKRWFFPRKKRSPSNTDPGPEHEGNPTPNPETSASAPGRQCVRMSTGGTGSGADRADRFEAEHRTLRLPRFVKVNDKIGSPIVLILRIHQRL